MRKLLASLVGGALGFALGCKDDAGGISAEDWFGMQERVFEEVCRCEVDAGEFEDMAQCLGYYGASSYDEPLLECYDAALQRYPVSQSILECQTRASRAYAECLVEEGCPDIPDPLTCDGAEIPGSWVCDGAEDCNNGEDEQGCPDPFVCDDDVEVPQSWVCDGFEDCEDGTDELECPATCTSSYEDALAECGSLPTAIDDDVYACAPKFTCGDDDEILSAWVCDGFEDCADGSDENDC